jgi:hypothetical protein
MWFFLIFVAVSILIFAVRVWGRPYYRRWATFAYRRIMGKRRPPTPPLEERLLNDGYSVYDLSDDNSAPKIDKPMVKF